MPIDVNGTVLTGNSSGSFAATDSVGNILYSQSSGGIVSKPQTSSGSSLLPMFMVGMSGSAWEQPVSSATYGKMPFNYTGGQGYQNIGNCYDLTNYRFNAPWQGFYLFKVHNYIYSPAGSYTDYCHPLFYVNGSSNFRRAGGTTYRIRLYGLPSTYAQDTDCCELIYLYPGDYVESWWYNSGQLQSYDPYCAFGGCYMGN